MPEFKIISNQFKTRFWDFADAAAGILAGMKLTPNALTFLGLALNGVAGLIYSTGAFFWGGCAALFAGVCDALDGALARKTGQASRFGAFIDSVFARFGEIFIFLGLIWYFAGGLTFFNPHAGR